MVNFKDHLLNVNISMTVGQIFTKIGNFIEDGQIFTQLNCNCAKLPNFEDFLNMFRGPFFRGHSVVCYTYCYRARFYVAT